MKEYELMYIVGETKESQLDMVKSEVATILAEEGATILENEGGFKRKMAYPIKHEVNGTYVILRLTMPDVDDFDSDQMIEKKTGSVDSIIRKLNLNQNILRSMIVRGEDVPVFKPYEPREARPMRGDRSSGRRPANPVRSKDHQMKTESAPKEEKKPETNIDDKLEEILNI